MPYGETEGRHRSFCKQAAAGQPPDVLDRSGLRCGSQSVTNPSAATVRGSSSLHANGRQRPNVGGRMALWREAASSRDAGSDHLLALTRPRRMRFFALFLAVLRAERLRSVLRGFLVFKYMTGRGI